MGAVVLMFVGLSITFLKITPPHEEKDTIVVGTNAEYQPFAYIVDDEIIGFDIDIAIEVCKRLGKTMILKDMPFDALVPAGAVGKVDIIAAGMTYTEERAKRVLFTTPYLSGDALVVITLAGTETISSLADLAGLTVVVNEGYTADLHLTEVTDLPLTRLPAPVDAFLALKSGRADAFVTAQSTATMFLKNSGSKAKVFSAIPLDGTGDDYALIVSKKYAHMLPAIENVLADMNEDGTLYDLQKKWGLA